MATTAYAEINGELVEAPEGALAWKYNDPIESARWLYDENEIADIEGEDCSLIERVFAHDLGIDESKEKREMSIDVTAAVVEVGSLYDMGDGCTVDYDVRIMIGEQSIQVGGWVICGWLRPGAHADLDGSGLASWGSSQSGGWTTCRGDGAISGTPRARADDDVIRIVPAEGRDGGGVVARKDVAQWRDADDDDADDVREEIVSAVGHALDMLDIDVAEPTADDVWDALSARAASEYDDCVRSGAEIAVVDHLSAGVVLVWRAGPDDDREMRWWPTRDEIAEAVEAVDGLADRIASDVADLSRGED